MVMENIALLSDPVLPRFLFTLHDYASGMAVFRAAGQAGVPMSENGHPTIGFMSAPGAAGFMGEGWWQALITQMEESAGQSIPHILDFGENCGYAMMAVRGGQRLGVLGGDSAAAKAVRQLYADLGRHLFITRPPSFDLIPSLSVTTHLAAFFTRSYCERTVPDHNSPEDKPEEGFPQ
jgi:hypothetical protein